MIIIIIKARNDTTEANYYFFLRGDSILFAKFHP